MKSVTVSHQRRPTRTPRRAAVLVWFVYIIPLMMLLLLALTDYGATARTGIELKNAVDAAALSAVKSWHDLGPDSALRDADAIFHGNAVLGSHRALRSTAADQQSPDFHGRGTEVTLGLLEDRDGRHVFHAIGMQTLTSDQWQLPAAQVFSNNGAIPTSSLCVRVRRSLVMSGVGGAWQEAAFGDYSLTAESFARIQFDRSVPQLVHIDQVADRVDSWETLN
jgi:hypothetical protein